MSTKDDDALELAVESALAEYLMRCDSGTAPDREQFLAKNPEMRERLESLLAAADWIEQLAGPTMAAQASQTGGEPTAKPLMMIVDPNEDTQPLSPATGGISQPPQSSSLPSSDPNAMTLPGSLQSAVPVFRSAH